MSLTADMEEMKAALLRADCKKDIRGRIGHLPLLEQRRLLVEVLAELRPEPASQTEPREEPARDLVAPPAQKVEPVLPAGTVSPRIAQKPKTELLVEFLQGSPNATIKAITVAVYGNADETNKTRVRSMLTSLKKQSRVKQGSAKGKWKAA